MGTTSIREVAERAGVSVGTVSNVLNRPDAVAPATRDRVRAAIEQLGFVRNESARHLRAGRSRTLGLVVLDVTNPFFTDVARGVEDAANEAGIAVILCNSDERREKEQAYLDLLEEQRVQGILITPVDVDDDRLGRLRARGVPVVLLDRHASAADQCSVAVDDVLGGELAASHLRDLGHERISYVSGPMSLAQCADRYRGAATALGREPEIIAGTALNVASGRDAGERLLGLRTPPTAVFCANDLLALGVLQVMVARGLSVPGDLSIVGYDDIEFAAAAAVPLSSVRQPRHLLGRTAAELLLAEGAAGTHVHRQVLFSPELVVRASSGPPKQV